MAALLRINIAAGKVHNLTKIALNVTVATSWPQPISLFFHVAPIVFVMFLVIGVERSAPAA